MQHSACAQHNTELYCKPLKHSELSLNRPPIGQYTAQYMVVSAVNLLLLLLLLFLSLSSSSPMLHCVWADCCSDRPLGGQFNSQASARTSSDTRVKCPVFGICHRFSGEAARLPHIPHNRPQTNTAKLNKGKEDRGGQKKKETLVFWEEQGRGMMEKSCGRKQTCFGHVSQICEKEILGKDELRYGHLFPTWISH